MNTEEKLKYILSTISDNRYTDIEKLTIIRSVWHNNEIGRMQKYTLSEIEDQVKNHTGITLDKTNTETRKKDIIKARQFAHYKAIKFTLIPLRSIAIYFGEKDHATVLHSYKTINGFLEVDKSFKEKHQQFLNE